MHSCDPQSPWIFERDEVDLLEEDLDDLYDVHSYVEGDHETMEQIVISEQLDTEEQADVAFEKQLDINWLFQKKENHWFSSDNTFHRDQNSFERTPWTQRPVLYEQIFRYAEEVFKHATCVYLQNADKKEHAFRIRVNSKMIPIKCASAFSEEIQDDSFSLAMAKKELKLALVYFDRLLISLAFLAVDGDAIAKQALSTGVLIKNHLEHKISRLQKGRQGFMR